MCCFAQQCVECGVQTGELGQLDFLIICKKFPNTRFKNILLNKEIMYFVYLYISYTIILYIITVKRMHMQCKFSSSQLVCTF